MLTELVLDHPLGTAVSDSRTSAGSCETSAPLPLATRVGEGEGERREAECPSTSLQ